MYVCISVSCPTVISVPLSEFYPFGATYDDNIFANDDDGSRNLNLETEFVFDNRHHSLVYVSLLFLSE